MTPIIITIGTTTQIAICIANSPSINKMSRRKKSVAKIQHITQKTSAITIILPKNDISPFIMFVCFCYYKYNNLFLIFQIILKYFSSITLFYYKRASLDFRFGLRDTNVIVMYETCCQSDDEDDQ